MINFWAVASLLLLSLPYIKTFKSINYVVGTGTRVKAIYSSSSNVEFIELGDETSNNLPKKLLYLPGIDGTGEYSNTALNTLQEDYRCWRMKINVDDRSSFLQIAQLVRKKMQEINDGQPMLLIGESFGGLLAAYIASRFPQLVDKLVLVNPATSYDRTLWRSTVPIITKTGPLFPAIGVSALVATSLDKRQIKEIGKNIIAKARNTDSKSNMMDEIAKELSPIMNLPNVLKAETLAWRAREWLDVGTFVTKDGINRVNSSTLILIGEEDRLLPSKGEGNRLKRLLTNAKVKVMNYPTRGHALLDNTFPLREVLSQFEDQIKRKSSGDLRINLPSGEDIKLLNERAGPLIKACSPVFFSTSSEDKVVEGLESIPLGCDGRPVLFVGNHQLFGMHQIFYTK